jgi:aquaporin Z
MNSLLKKAVAECFGTFVLVFVACGVALATGGGLVATSLAFGLVIVAMAFSIGRISGCHINPAVSLGCLLTKRMTVKDFLVYVCAQCVGAILGALLVFGCFKMAGVVGNYAFGASNYAVGGDYSFGGVVAALITEVVLTFIFVLVILNVTDKKADESGVSKFAGLIIGLTLTLVHLIGINLTGTSVNPARSLGTAVANLVYGSGEAKALAHLWMFIVGPLCGGALAALCYNVLFAKDAKDESSNL